MIKDETNLTDVMVRHPKWEKVEVGYEFQPGESFRCEGEHGAFEHRGYFPLTVHDDGYVYFRDTTWQPPVEPLKVGDLIETVGQAASLPVGTIVVSTCNTPIRKVDMGVWRQVNAERALLLDDPEMSGYGDRIIHLPNNYYAE